VLDEVTGGGFRKIKEMFYKSKILIPSRGEVAILLHLAKYKKKVGNRPMECDDLVKQICL
jgi:hypothetical protein